MDAYHKMLSKVYEASGGRETVDIDFVEIAKREGYFPSIDDIVSHMKAESWVTESRPNIVRMTHWGVAEAKKNGGERPDAARAIERDTNRLIAASRDLGVLAEEFGAEPKSDRLKPVEAKFAEMAEFIKSIRSAI